MTNWGDPAAVAYCGLVCAGCPGLDDECVGCRQGGGDTPCLVRDCCLERGYQGCWECDEAPCERGPFGNPQSVGLCTALIQTVQARTLEGMMALVQRRLGQVINMGAMSGLSAAEVLARLNAE